VILGTFVICSGSRSFSVKRSAPLSVLPSASRWMATPHCAAQCAKCPNENEVWKHTKLRSPKYLNNLVEQNHRGIHHIAEAELLRRIDKEQFSLRTLRRKDRAAATIWHAVLAV
jgi:transposase-like protein